MTTADLQVLPAAPICIRFPSAWLTAALCAAVGVVFLLPSLNAWLQFDRLAIASGQWWRLLTCHVTHWSWGHLGWDLAVFALLGWQAERHGRTSMVVCMIVSGFAISVSTWYLTPQLETFRGLSGIGSALFALLAVTMLREHWRQRHMWWVVVTGGLVLGFAAKIVFELGTGRTVFVDSAAASFTPMPLAHVVGAAVGALIALTPRRP